MADVQILGPTRAERDLESAIEDALDARSVPFASDARVWVVDVEAPAAIVRALRELGWREPIEGLGLQPVPVGSPDIEFP